METTATLPLYHPGQARLDALVEHAKTTIAVCGRRWGKTYYAADKMLNTCLDRPGRMEGLIAPSYDLTSIHWDTFCALLGRLEAESGVTLAEVHKSGRHVDFINGSRCFWRSADDPKIVRGRGYNRVWLDEGIWIPKSTYDGSIIPSLADLDGDLVAITTPAGRAGWVYEEFERARAGEPGYAWVQLPSTDNPNPAIKRHVERARRTLPPLVFEQEYLAQFVEDLAALFRGLEAAIGGELEEPQAECQYVVGVDVARTAHWTVGEVLRLSGGPPYQVVAEDRFHEMDWPEQVDRLVRLGRRYHEAPIVVDDTGERGGVLAMLRERNYPAIGYTFTEKSRRDLLDSLAVAVSQRDVRIPAEMGDDLLAEMRSFAVRLDEKTGRTKYASRAGYDDRVFALALALHGAPARHAGERLSVGLRDDEEEDAEDREDERSELDKAW